MNTAIVEMTNSTWHTLASMGIPKKNIKLDKARGLAFVKCSNTEADTIKILIDSATIHKA